MFYSRKAITVAMLLMIAQAVSAASQNSQRIPEPDRISQGEGPFERLIIRGATVIDGTGTPPRGPVDIVIECNCIVEIKSVGVLHVPIDESKRPQGATKEIDASGMFVMPGFIDLHAHIGGFPKSPEAEYVYKLWMRHGVTTTRNAGSGASDFVLNEKNRSENNKIVAPGILPMRDPKREMDGKTVHP
jgi:imidazolonepropionase-like amidohydrolase